MTIVVVMLEVDGSKNSPNLQLIKLLTNNQQTICSIRERKKEVLNVDYVMRKPHSAFLS